MLNPETNIATVYLNGCFKDLSEKVNSAVKTLTPFADRFEGIAVRGVSGLLVGPMVASLLKKPWCVVRKPGEGTHSEHRTVEGWFGFKTYIIIDDLIATGGTLKTIQNAVRAWAESKDQEQPDCVGFYCYNYDEVQWRGDGKKHNYYDKYFLFPTASEKPAVSKKIAEAVGSRPAVTCFAY